MLKFLTGAAALALAASAVSADPGGNKGSGPEKGQGGGKSHAADVKGDARGKGKAASKADHGGDQGAKPHKLDKAEARHGEPGKKVAKAEREPFKKVKQDKLRDDDAQFVRDRDRADRADRGDRGQSGWKDFAKGSRGLIDGCPPGLAKKNNGCLPPGLARKAGAGAGFFDRPDWWGLNDRWHEGVNWSDGRYGYTDGYMVRYGDNGIQSWLPLLGGALAPGNLWPNQFQSVALPDYYQDYYGLGAADGYRYYDDTLFRVDPQTSAITAIAALLTGDSLDVGQRLPQGYDVYNVPFSHRDEYADGPDATYRYSDGTVYKVDPTTQLIEAAIQLLT